jgi:hypothetical protein
MVPLLALLSAARLAGTSGVRSHDEQDGISFDGIVCFYETREWKPMGTRRHDNCP